ERELVVDGALTIVQVGVAHPARLDAHEGLAGTRVGHVHRHRLHRRPLGAGDHALDLVHTHLLQRDLAEVDGNRTRRTGIARPTRFEGGGAHQVPGHLRRRTYRLARVRA